MPRAAAASPWSACAAPASPRWAARWLANWRTPFVELNGAIEAEAGMPLNEIFMLYGQPGFRRLERRCLESIIARHEAAVITVGGGIVSEAETFNLLLMNCYTVWVKASPEEHMSRVVAQGDLRPMEGSAEAMEDMRRILVARESLYSKADFTLDTTGRTPEECLNQAASSRHPHPLNHPRTPTDKSPQRRTP
jgi:shikimate kinase